MSHAPQKQERDIIDELTSLPMNLFTIRRIFLILTRLHYSSPTNFGPEYPDPMRKFYWTKEKDSPMKITRDYEYDPKVIEQTPAIYVGTGDVDYQKNVVDNKKGPNSDRSGAIGIKTATTSVILRHISGQPDEATQLCDMSAQFYLGIRDMIMTQMSGMIRGFEVLKQSTSKPFLRDPGEADQQFISDLIMSLTFNAAWQTLTESHRIKTVAFEDIKPILST